MKTRNVSKRLSALILAVCLLAAQLPAVQAAGKQVTVTWSLTNIQTPATSTVETNMPLEVTLTAEEGYILPETVAVTGAAQDAYPLTEGVLSIPAEEIEDNLTITAEGIKVYSVEWNLTGLAADPQQDQVQEGVNIAATLTAQKGYSLPDDVTVAGASKKTYNKADGALSIEWADITGDITITAAGVKVYPVIWDLAGLTAAPRQDQVLENGQITTTLTAVEGYSLPADVTVTGATKKTYNKTDGTLSIEWADITGDDNGNVTIQAEGVRNIYNITVEGSNGQYVDLESGTQAAFESDVAFTVKPRDGYAVMEVKASYRSKEGLHEITVPYDSASGKYHLTMPAGELTIALSWEFTGENYRVEANGETIEAVNGWYAAKEAAIYPVEPAKQISLEKDGGYQDHLDISEGETSFYLNGDNDALPRGPIKINLDGTVPSIKIQLAGVDLEKNYSTLTVPGMSLTILADDGQGSGVVPDSIAYILLTQEDFEAIDANKDFELDAEELEKLASQSWTAYADQCVLNDRSGKYVIVAKASDVAGNTNYFACGFSCDMLPPSIENVTIESAGKDVCQVDEASGIYHVKDTAAADEKIVLTVPFTDDVTDQGITPRAPKIIGFYRGLSSAEGGYVSEQKTGKTLPYLTYTEWLWNSRQQSWYFQIELHIDGDKGMADGFYQFEITLQDAASNISEAYTSPEFRISRNAPSVELTYDGYTGYDDGAVYKTEAPVSDRFDSPAVQTGAANHASDKVFYINRGKTVAIGLSSDTDMIKDWSVTAKLNGAGEVDAAGLAGVKVTADKLRFTVNGSKADEGKYDFTVHVTAFNDCTTNIVFTIVVDRTDPAADEITGVGFTSDTAGTPVFGEAVQSNVWTNQGDVRLTMANIKDEGGLLEACISVPEGIAGLETISDGTWTGTISGEQNHTYSVTISDKAGNDAVKTFTAKIDTTSAADITVKARQDSTDMALIADQFTFGVFHVDYNKLSVSVEDPQPADPGVYDDSAETTSQIREVEYHFLTNREPQYKEFYAYYDEDGTKQYYTQAEVKADAAVSEKVQSNIQSYLSTIEADQSGDIWKECIRDSVDDPNRVATDAIATNRQYVVFFRVWDNANNMSSFFRSVIIVDDVAPIVTFTIDENAPAVAQANGSKIYTGPVPVKISVAEPNSETDSYSGINKVTYTVYYGNAEVFTTGNFEELPDANIPEKGNAPANPNAGLVEQGASASEKTIVLDDLDGKIIDANNIYIKVDVQDLSGNTTSYTSDGQVGFIAIDKANPDVTVAFDGTQLNGRYYGAQRSATITVTDNNFDPATGIKIDTTGTIGEWTASAPDSYGKTVYSARIVFSDGQHHFAVTEVNDAANHTTTGANVAYNVTDQRDFVVDTVAPAASVRFTRTDGQGFGAYNNADIEMTVSVAETNFFANGVNLTVRKDGTPVPVDLVWGNAGGSHSAAFTFTEEGDYEVGLSVTDLASHSNQTETAHFTLDKTPPEIEIRNVEDLHAYNAETVVPAIDVTDINYDVFGVTISLAGVYGGTGHYDEADIENGQSFGFENIQDDDLYTLSVRATDEAENESVMEIRFSVNRNGSVFSGDEEIAKAMENGVPYFKADTLPPIRVIETNVDIVESATLYLTRDNSNIDLVEGSDYTITRRDVNGGWSQYVYELNKDLFQADGVYRVSLVTKDAAGNAKNAESVVSFIVDNTPPVLFVTDLESGEEYPDELKHVIFTPNDNLVLSEIVVILNGEEIAKWNAEEISQMLRDGNEFSFEIPESNSKQSVEIVLRDAAGNENETEKRIIDGFTVSTNPFVRFYNNKPLFYGVIIAAAVAVGGIAVLLARGKKKQKVSK